jgi:putative ABC transport system ATP-binding protein
MPTPAPAAVQCRGISMEFGDGSQVARVLHGVDATFRAGELALLVGPSGCGKTTLISIIAGLLTPTAGHVEVFGTRLDGLRRQALARFRLDTVGFVFQQYNLIGALSAAENAAVPLIAAGVPRREAIARARHLLAQLDLAAHVDKLPAQLSGGQQQRVAIARALANAPKLLICDEPTAALDAGAGQRVMALLRAVAPDRDRACVVVTHDTRIHAHADRIVAMEDGRIR